MTIVSDDAEKWRLHAESYHRLIAHPGHAKYLHDRGIIETILALLGPVNGERILDAGCGSGWLMDMLNPEQGWECDFVLPAGRPGNVHSSVQDLCRTDYPSGFFDVTVCSLVLNYVADLGGALAELHRISRVGGRLIIALPHPYFFNTGEVTAGGHFALSRDLSQPGPRWDYLIAGTAGPFTYYYRPLDHYVNTLIQTGWRLEHMREWTVDCDDYRAHVREEGNRPPPSDRVPLFLFICARRGGEG